VNGLVANARHEASHAVAAVVLGCNVLSVNIEFGWETAGEVFYQPGTDLEVNAVIALAGRSRALLVSGDELLHRYRWHSDMEVASASCLALAGGDELAAGELAEVLQSRANELIVRHWDAVDGIAIGLLEHHRLSGGQVLEFGFGRRR
jgi:hypothetical protein